MYLINQWSPNLYVLCSQHLSAWYCIDIVRRNSEFFAHGSYRVKYFIHSPAHPSSTMPSVNSFLENSHCVAALNFQAITRTLRLAGSNLRSSQKRPIPSAMILSSSPGSGDEIKTHKNQNAINNVSCKYLTRYRSHPVG